MAVVKVVVALAVFTLLGISWQVEAATITAASCSRTDVGNAVTSAVDGDTVQIPAGTCSWTSQLNISAAITLIGAGIDQTVILDDVQKVTQNENVILFTGLNTATKCIRVSSFTLKAGSVTTKALAPALGIGGFSHCFRVDHMKFSNLLSRAFWFTGDLWGVVDHCTFISTVNVEPFLIYHDRWQGIGVNGNNSWATPANLGTQQFIFFEDNIFDATGGAVTGTDSTGGGRAVFRHNTFINMVLSNHGTESSGIVRSFRVWEIYNNTFTFPGPGTFFSAVGLRGGTGVVHDNTFTGFDNAVTGSNFRDNQAFAPWGQCNGTSPYDQNGAGGYPCIDQVGRGQGDLMDMLAPTYTPTPVTWPRQASEPLYVWNNVVNGGVVASGQTPNVVVGRDILLTPMPNYTPFTYPHPLVGGTQTAAPSLPAGLTVR